MEFSKRNLRFFEMAKQASYYFDFPRLKYGCVLTQGNRVISNGWNSSRTHPLQKKLNRLREFSNNDGYGSDVARLHAETHCLLPFDAEDGLNRAEIYVYRRSGDDKGMARPCPGCMSRIKELGIRKIYYTTPLGYAMEEIG